MPSQPLPDVPNTLMLQFKGTVNGQPFMHTLHLTHSASTPSQADMNSLATTLNTWWSTNIRPLQFTGTILTQTVLTDVASRTGVQAVNTTSQTGSLAGVPLPNSVAYAVGWSIARRFRGGHPRTYHTGLITADSTTGNTIVSTKRTSILNAWGSLQAALSGASLATLPALQLVSVSYYSGHTIDSKGNRIPTLRANPVIDVISGPKGDNRLDSQRKRLGRPL